MGNKFLENPCFSNLTRLVVRISQLDFKVCFPEVENFPRIQTTKLIEATMVPGIQLSVFSSPQSTARLIILSLSNKATFPWSFILPDHLLTQSPLLSTRSFKTWLRLTRTEPCWAITPIRLDTVQLALILRKDRYTQGVFQGVYPSDKLPASVSSYPALFTANVGTSDKSGSPWVAFYFTKEKRRRIFRFVRITSR